MDKPIIYEYDQELPNFYDAFVAQAYGRGADMFDDNLERCSSIPRTGLPAARMLADARRRPCSPIRTNQPSSPR